MRQEDEMLARYLRDIKDIKGKALLTAEREKELGTIIQNPLSSKEAVKEAQDEFVLSNLGLVVDIALKMYARISGFYDANLSILDLIQIGNEALPRIVKHFDPTLNNKFSSYAYESIERWMMKAVKQSGFVRLPVDYFRRVHNADAVEEKFGKISDKEMAEKTGHTEETILVDRVARNMRVHPEDINALFETVASNDTPITDALHHKNVRNYVYAKIKLLRPKYRDVLLYRFFSTDEMTFEQIGERMGMTKQNVMITLRASLRKIKAIIREDKAFQDIRFQQNKKQKGAKHEKK